MLALRAHWGEDVKLFGISVVKQKSLGDAIAVVKQQDAINL